MVKRSLVETASEKYIKKARASACKGQKVVRGTKSVKLDVMAVYRSGGADPDTRQPGDLFVTIKVQEDPVFRRDKANIHVDAVLSVTQVKPGTQPGQQVVLQGERNLSKRQCNLNEKFAKEERDDDEDDDAAAGAS